VVSGATISGTSTTAFSPAAGDRVRVQVACLNATDHLGDTFTCVDNHSNSYGTPVLAGTPGDGDGGCYLFVWDFVYSSAPGSTTIKVTKTSSNAQMDFLILPTRYAGAAADQSTAAHNNFSEAGTSTTTYQIALTPTKQGSDIVVLAAPNYNGGATGAVTAIAGTTTLADWQDSGVGSRGTFGRATSLTGVTGSPVTFGWTSANPSPFGYGVMAIEMLPADGVIPDQTATGIVPNGVTSAVMTWPTNPVAGSKALVLVTSFNPITSVIDNGTTPTTYTLDANDNDNGAADYFVQVFRADNIKLPSSGSYHVTITFGASAQAVAGGRTYLGLAAGAPASKNEQTTGSVNSAVPATGSLSPSAGDLLFGGFLTDASTTTVTLTTSGATSLESNGSVFPVGAVADKVVTATGSQNLAWTVSSATDWATVIARYAFAASGSAVTSAVTADLSAMTPSAALAEGMSAAVTADLSAMTPSASVAVAVPVTSTASADLSAMTPAVTLIASDVNAVVTGDLSAMSPSASAGVANPVTSTASASLGSMTPSASLLESFIGQAALPGNGGIAASGFPAYLGAVSMGGTGGITGAPERTETLLVNGQDIMQCSSAFTADLSSVVSVPPKRTANVTVPGKHGAVRVPRKLYAPSVMAMTIWVRGMNADGTFPPGGQRDKVFYQNLDALLQMFSGTVSLEHVMPDATSRVISAEVLDAIDFTRYAWSSESTGKIGVTLSAVDPFWRDPAPADAAAITASSSTTVQLADFASSTGPIEDAVITFVGPCNNPKLASGDWWVQYGDSLGAGESIAVDTGAWTLQGAGGLTADYSKLTHAGIGPWFALEPAPGGPVVTFSVTGGGTGTCGISARNSFLGG
jgi:hypothetical protein